MIDILLGAIKDYKNVTSINPLFEITLIKLTSLTDSNPTKILESPKVIEKSIPKVETKQIEEIIEQEKAQG